MVKADVYTVEGLAYWAKLDQPRRNPFINEEQYSIKLYVDTRNKKLLESLNLTSSIKKDDIGEGFSFILNAVTKSGKPAIPPKVYDCDMNDVTHDVLIGNGSKVVVEFAVLEVPGGLADNEVITLPIVIRLIVISYVKSLLRVQSKLVTLPTKPS